MAAPDLPEKDEPNPLAEVAHDFNNTLQVIVSNLELLKRHLARQQTVPMSRDALLHRIEAALKAAKDASDLGERLIDLSNDAGIKRE